MPSRIWDAKKQKWVIVDQSKLALQTQVIDALGYYDKYDEDGNVIR